ncbi:hypothetical protein LMB83_01445 [Limosilactobacillus reuteri]|uniref:hypothetical protein n=1 Tax=Limosilactobacillus reuteri TaxID=1598 RepID=UPI001E34E4D9|nr:hypothetical protein [Limosilactobacillus reuteri]MCC4410705.1 hypothetical protein [Limosilactobacillus reuteri]MCC4424586.1 hypothetical protein [Limosilactobacillus reuteri]
MVKPLDDKFLAKVTGGYGYGNFVASAIYSVAKSAWHHRRDIGQGYLDSPFH